MRSTNHLRKRLFLSALLIVSMLVSVACGPDCSGLCNDIVDICDRAPNCDALTPAEKAQIQAACDEFASFGVSSCVEACEVMPGELKDFFGKAVDIAKEALDDAGC
jgi:hypothetical protein